MLVCGVCVSVYYVCMCMCVCVIFTSTSCTRCLHYCFWNVCSHNPLQKPENNHVRISDGNVRISDAMVTDIFLTNGIAKPFFWGGGGGGGFDLSHACTA